MEKNTLVSIIAIILGIIIIACPMFGLITVDLLFGISILFIGAFCIIVGYAGISSKTNNMLNLIVGILLIIFAILLIIYPSLFAFLAAFIIYIAGILLVILGVINIIANKNSIGLYVGLFSVIMGILYIIFGYFIADPFVLGVLIGVWLLVSGIMGILKQ